MLSSSTLTTWCKEPTLWKRPWCWKSLKAGREGGDRAWDGWCHWLNRHESEQTLGDGGGEGSVACCSPWGRKELGTTEQQQKWSTNPLLCFLLYHSHLIFVTLLWGPCSGNKSIRTCSQEANQQFRFCYYNLPWPGAHSFTSSGLNFLFC